MGASQGAPDTASNTNIPAGHLQTPCAIDSRLHWSCCPRAARLGRWPRGGIRGHI